MDKVDNKPEIEPKQRFAAEDIIAFSRELPQNLKLANEGKPIGSGILTTSIMPDLIATAQQVNGEKKKLIPKKPDEAVFWAITGIRFPKGLSPLNQYHGFPDEIINLKPLTTGESVQLSQNQLKDVGITLGILLAQHARANKPLTELKPTLGELGKKRSELLIKSKDELHFLDTVLQVISTKPVSKEQK